MSPAKYSPLRTILTMVGIYITFAYTSGTVSFWKNHGEPGKHTGRRARRVNTLVTDYDVELNRTLNHLIETAAGPRDPRVLDLINSLLDPPSDHMYKIPRSIMTTPQEKEIIKVLGKKVSVSD